MNIYKCPSCGEKAFNPWTKAMAGQLNSKGKACSHCGKHITNGTGATIFNAIFSICMLVIVVVGYLKFPNYDLYIIISVIAAELLIPRLVNAFCFKMELTRRKDSLS